MGVVQMTIPQQWEQVPVPQTSTAQQNGQYTTSQVLMEGYRSNVMHSGDRPGHPQHDAAALQARCPAFSALIS